MRQDNFAKNRRGAIATGNRSKSRSGPLFRASAHTGMEYAGCGDAYVESAETLLLYTKCGPEEFLRRTDWFAGANLSVPP